MCISFPPYFDHDAFMHHPMHVLEAPDIRGVQYLAPLHIILNGYILAFISKVIDPNLYVGYIQAHVNIV